MKNTQNNMENTHDEIKLEQTCGACPEQYDATFNGDVVGYLRLRHGAFRVDYTPTGETIYRANPNGDGIFEAEERDFYLEKAKKAIFNKMFPSNTPDLLHAAKAALETLSRPAIFPEDIEAVRKMLSEVIKKSETV